MNKDFLELIKTRTSVREFTGEPIPKEDILEIIKSRGLKLKYPSTLNIHYT